MCGARAAARVIVPSAAAADQLRRTFENHRLLASSPADRALVLPQILTRSGWYDAMHSRLPSPPRRLTDLEREVLLNAAARDAAASEVEPPFRLRAGLLVEMLALYDDLRRRDSSVDDFERVLARELERDADDDRGAARLLKQTRFLAAAFRGYEARRDATGAVDEYALRTKLLEVAPSRPLRHIVVTVGERSVDSAGLWPADLALLTQLPLLEQIDIVATHATIAAGLLDRLEKFMPGFEEGELPHDPDEVVDHSTRPVLIAPSETQSFTVSRDREDELSSIAAAVKTAGPSDLDRRAVVFKRPLPYVYLARDVFADAGIPYQTFDALPLAAEPYAAALDLVFEFVTSNFTREPVVALLGSPHFSFEIDGTPIRRSDVAALNRALSDEGYFGGVENLRAVRAMEGGEGGCRRRRGTARAGRNRTPVGAARCAARVSRRARSHSRDWRSAARAASARAQGGALCDSRTAEGPSVPGRFADRAVERRRDDSTMDRRADVRAARRSCGRAAARRAGRAVRRIRRSVSRRPRGRRVAAAFVEEHLLSGVAA